MFWLRRVNVQRRATVRLFDDGHVDGVVREQDFADVAEQDAETRSTAAASAFII